MRIAILGMGSIGARHAQNLLEMGETDLIGCDYRAADVRAGFQFPIMNSLEYVWAARPDAVLICTPPATHTTLALDAIESGAHVFIEKPIATTVADATHLVRAAEQKNVQLAVGYQLRFHCYGIERHRYQQKLSIVHQQDMSTWPSLYIKDVLDEFSHEIDVAFYLNGPAQSVVARNRGYRWNIEIQHQTAYSNIQINAGPGPFARWIAATAGAWQFNICKNDQAYKDELAAFLSVCQGSTWNDRLCSGAEAAHVVRIIEACRESARECRVVALA